MDIKEFEKKMSMNNMALQQVKKLAKQLKPNNVDVGVSTAFTVDFRLEWGKGWQGDSLDIKVESWGSNKRIDVYASGEKTHYIRMTLTPANINKIYSAGIKAYKEMNR